MRDFGLVDMPYPMRKMSLTPVGILSAAATKDLTNSYSFRRGIQSFPTVGDPVLLPTHRANEVHRRISETAVYDRTVIPLAADAEVRIDPDRLFGRHLPFSATPSAASPASAAGLIRWSRRRTPEPRRQQGRRPERQVHRPRSQREYAETFKDLGAKVFSRSEAAPNNSPSRCGSGTLTNGPPSLKPLQGPSGQRSCMHSARCGTG